MNDRVFISYCSADKVIADTICHRLEEHGLRCWIAPRDITSSDWATSIMEGLHNSSIFVVVISKNSIASPEVIKEVTEATRTCQYLLPFKVDQNELSDRLRYHLGPCHWVDAITPPLEAHIQELIQRIDHLSDKDAVYSNQNKLVLQERVYLPRNHFLGRDHEIKEVADRLKENHVLFLQGMGGIGKSEIAKGYAQRYRECYDTILFTSFTTNLADLIGGEEVGIKNLLRQEGENNDQWIERKLETLKAITNTRTLIVIDNFDIGYDPLMEAVFSLPCHVLVTSRYDHPDYPSMAIGQIADYEQVRKLFLIHYGRRTSDKDIEIIDKILELTKCHTITVELIAKQMKASFLKPSQMLDRLQSAGLNLHLKEKIKKEGSEIGLTSFDYIRSLFQMSGLTEEEQHLLCCMSFVPYSGIDIHALGEILQIDDYDIFNSLIAKSWLHYSEDDDMISLHPVICDVVREELKPTAMGCQDYIHGMYEKMISIWFFQIEEKNKLYPLLRFYLHQFPDPIPELWREYLEFINIPWICNDFGLAVETGKRVFQFAIDYFGDGSEEAGDAAYGYGTAYHNSGDDEQAEKWYQEALKHWLNCLSPDNSKLAVVYMKIGRCARLRDDLDRAKALYQASGEIYAQLLQKSETWPEGDDCPPYYRDYFVELERLAIAEHRYDDALKICKETQEMEIRVHGEGSAACAYTYSDMGICCSMLGEYEQADDFFQKALQINKNVNGELSIQTIRTREGIANNFLKKGDKQRAIELYTQLEFDAEKAYGQDATITKRIHDKRAVLCS